jgi:hypothetical protein
MVSSGCGIDFLLHLWESGSLFAHFVGVSDYGQRLMAMEGVDQHAGWQLLARLTVNRLDYLQWLFFRPGLINGFLMLMGWMYSSMKWRERSEHLVLCSTTLTFLLFLMFMPAHFKPFVFVEMQQRYLTVLLPMLSIAASGALDAVIKSLPDRASCKFAFLASLVPCLLYNICIPNDMTHSAVQRGSTQRLEGIYQAVRDARSQGITSLVLPEKFAQVIPDIYRFYGVRLVYYDLTTLASTEAMRTFLKGGRERALYVPRRGFTWPLEHLLKRGEYESSTEKSEACGVDLVLDKATFHNYGIRVPDSSLKYWLARWGLVSREQELVGWVYRLRKDFK